MSEYQLTQGIIELSDATIWDAAKLEWRLTEVYEAESLKKGKRYTDKTRNETMLSEMAMKVAQR